MRPTLAFDLVVTMDRNAALTAVADALGGTGGWIVDHSLFSDVMAVVRFALPGDRATDFGARLAEHGLMLDPAPTDQPTGDEITGRLTLTFTRGTGDLKRAVPAFQ